MRYRRKPEEFEAITFDELVAHGIANPDGGSIINGMPWSFKYKGHPITHEDDGCYLVPASRGGTMRFTREDMLISDEKGLYVCKRDIFEAVYEPVE